MRLSQEIYWQGTEPCRYQSFWVLDFWANQAYYYTMKYVVCISARAKDRLDQFRLSNNLGRFPVRHLVHGSYRDNRPPGAKKSETFSIRMRPVTIQTVVQPEKMVELLELVDTIDIVTRYDRTDSSMVSHILGTFLDAVIMGDLVDTNAPFARDLDDKPNDVARQTIATQASEYNLQQATLK
jgi:hypothetical protein